VPEGLAIEPLTPGRFDALAELFREGGDPRWCWCQFWRLRAKDFAASKVPQLRQRLRDLSGASPAPGLVALRGDRAVGWCSLGPREDFERLEHSRTIPRVDDDPVWSIVCFAVSKTARGDGVATALLQGAIRWARDQGAKTLEAYPVEIEPGVPMNANSAFMGTLPMFEGAGFRVVSATGSTTDGRPRVVVRRGLRR
jgi:GNAT superfamily N-acetyltransferase